MNATRKKRRKVKRPLLHKHTHTVDHAKTVATAEKEGELSEFKAGCGRI